MVPRYLALLSVCFIAAIYNAPVDIASRDDGSMCVHGIYGSCDVADPLLCDIIRSPEFERLKGVHQHGPWHYVVGPSEFTRWEHSLGVFMLTAMYGGSYYEQVAALLHDISHTVFSHVGGWIYHADYKRADQHQDEIHEWYLKHTGIADLLHAYGISIDDVHHKAGEFPVLEQSLPDICADRLDYNLQGAYYEGIATQEDITAIVHALHHDNGVWYFDNLEVARMFAENSVIMARNMWGGPANNTVYYTLGSVLRYAVDNGILTMDDIHFGTDDVIWGILCQSDDPRIMHDMAIIRRYQAVFFYDSEQYTFWTQAKFRGIDPYVMYEDGVYRVSSCDDRFRRLFNQAQHDVTYGWPVRCVYT